MGKGGSLSAGAMGRAMPSGYQNSCGKLMLNFNNYDLSRQKAKKQQFDL